MDTTTDYCSYPVALKLDFPEVQHHPAETLVEVILAITNFIYTGDELVQFVRYSVGAPQSTRLSKVSRAYSVDWSSSLHDHAGRGPAPHDVDSEISDHHDDSSIRLHRLVKKAVLVIVQDEEASLTQEEASRIANQHELSLHVSILGKTVKAKLCFPEKKHIQANVPFLVETLERVCQMTAESPGRPLHELDFLCHSNSEYITKTSTVPAKIIDASLLDVITEQIKARPNSIAIDSWDGRFTYIELYKASIQIASKLLISGVIPEERIPVCMKKSKWAIAAMFGVLFAGATCVPLDIRSPKSRLATLIEDLGASRVVGDQSTARNFKDLNIQFVSCPSNLRGDCKEVTELPSISPSANAFIYFTSGSTGKPKGVVSEHGAFYAKVLELAKAFSYDKNSRVFQYSAYVFDVIMGDIFSPLSRGGCVCIPSEEDRMNYLSSIMNTLNVTHACLTPTVLSQIHPEDVPCLRYVFVGGETLDRPRFLLWHEHVNFNVVYGTTESLTWDSVARSEDLNSDCNNIGRAMGSCLWVTDPTATDRLMPIGACGEILVEGPLVAREYMNDSGATSAKFVPAPLWLQSLRNQKNIRCYRSGDIGYRNADGTVSFIGRVDTQVKLRGQRVELGEIEHNVKLADSLIKQVAVQVFKIPARGNIEMLAAFIQDSVKTTDNEKSDRIIPLSQTDRERFMRLQYKIFEALPQYMVPSLFIPVTAMPLTVTGKLDRKTLRAWYSSLDSNEAAQFFLDPSSDSRKPESDAEKLIQELWADLLKLPVTSIGAESIFWQLGGDSIKAMELVTQLREHGKTLTVANVTKCPKLCDMAAALTDLQSAIQDENPPEAFALLNGVGKVSHFIRDVARSCEISEDLIEDMYPTTPMQEAVMAVSAHRIGSYRSQFTFKLPTSFNVGRFRSAWERLAETQPIFRTRIVVMPTTGALQVVVRSKINWCAGNSLNEYLDADTQKQMTYGVELVRYAIIREQTTTYFVWSGHHVVYDGWSLPRMFEAVKQFYDTGSVPKAAPYNKFLQHILQTNADQDESDRFWRNQFPESTIQYPRLPSPDYVSKSSQNKSSILTLSQKTQSKVTMATIVKAAWSIVTAQYTGTDKATFGVTLSGRDIPVANISEMLGPTIATVPVLIKVDYTRKLEDFLQRIQDQMIQIRQHQHYGIQRIRRLSPETQSAANIVNLLAVEYAYNTYAASNPFESLGISTIQLKEEDFQDIPLIVECKIQKDKLETRIQYDKGVIPDEEVANLLYQFEHVISQLLLSSSDVTLGDLNLLSPQHMQQLKTWNSKIPQPLRATVHSLVEARVKARPDAIALSGFDGKRTYAELNNLSETLTEHLIHLGVGIESRVVLCFTKSSWPIVSMLAILKSGGACVSTNPAHPTQRILEICDDVEANVLLCDTENMERFKDHVPNVIAVNASLFDHLKNTKLEKLRPSVTPGNAAFVVYTSGSTGKPKGVMLEHQSVCTSLEINARVMHIKPETRAVQFSAYTFDASVCEIFSTLITGACVVVISEEERMNNLPKAINDTNADWIMLTPTVAQLFGPDAVPKLKTLIFGGEALNTQILQPWIDHVQLANYWGPSECSNSGCINNNLTLKGDPLNIGRPSGCGVWITEVNKPDRLAAIGCVGEILVEGPIVSREYLKRPEANAKSFITNPAWAQVEPGRSRRFYRTGDLARYNFDGTVTFSGRADTQVKIRGQRVELGEIEQALKAQAEFEQVVVEVVTNGSKGSTQMLAAFVVVNDSEDEGLENRSVLPMVSGLRDSFTTIQRKLNDILPHYMIPSLFIPLTKLPLSPSAKLERKTLRSWVSAMSNSELAQYTLSENNSSEPVTTESERQLQKLWAQVLDTPEEMIGARDNFFLLGGDSVLAMKLTAAARGLRLVISVAEVFQFPQLSEMANALKSTKDTRENGSYKPLKPFALISDSTDINTCVHEAAKECSIDENEIEDIYPATPMQEALMAISAHQPKAYTNQLVFRLPSSGFDLQRFKEAWEALSKAQSIFRTRIVSTPEIGALQVVLKSNFRWQSSSSVEQYLENDIKVPMVYGTELVRYAIVNEKDDSYFVWTGHHAIYDGWAQPLMFDEVIRHYEQGTLTAEEPYNQFVKYLATLDIDVSDEFWRDQFPNIVSIYPRLPSSKYNPQPRQTQTSSVKFKRKARSMVTTATVIQAAWALITAKQAGTDDAIFGLTLAGRDAPVHGIEDMMGPTITTVPMRIGIDNTQTIAEFLHDVQEQASQIKMHQFAGLQRIRQLSPEARSAVEFQNLLVINPNDSSEIENVSSRLGLEHVDCDQSDFMGYSLTIECSINSATSSVSLNAQYDNKVIDDGEMTCLLHQFEHIIQQLFEQPDSTTIHNINMISAYDHSLFAKWNPEKLPFVDETIHSVIEKQCRRIPDALAIDGFDGSHTYSDLNVLTDLLAEHLASLGVGPECRVVLCFGKSKWPIFAMLAILKAGGVCVSTNPEHPSSRLLEICDDAQVSVVLCDTEVKERFLDHGLKIVEVNDQLINRLKAEPRSPQAAELPLSRTSSPGESVSSTPSSAPVLSSSETSLTSNELSMDSNSSTTSVEGVNSSNAAVIVYTSGSTGKPKGAVLEHRSLCTSLITMGKQCGMTPHSRTLQFSAYTFDVHMLEIFGTLIAGGCICVVSEEERMNRLEEVIAERKVNWSSLTPTVARLLAPERLPLLKTLYLIGEPLARQDYHQWANHVQLLNAYGPAEASVAACITRRGVTLDADPRNIGHSINCNLWITDHQRPDCLVPIGCVGELLIEGNIVGRGYLNRPKITAKSFVTDLAWSHRTSDDKSTTPRRFYRTGDLAKYNSNGSITFIGRNDTQVKIRGQRIELGEIEHALISQQPTFEQAVVEVGKLSSNRNTQTLIAFIVNREDSDTEKGNKNKDDSMPLLSMTSKRKKLYKEAQQNLGKTLPQYMVPTLFLPLKSLPVSPSGKLERKILRQWMSKLVDKTDVLAPYHLNETFESQPVSTENEKSFQELWAQILKIHKEKINANDNFFSLGGDSVMAMKMTAAARKSGLSLSVTEVFRFPVLKEMAKLAQKNITDEHAYDDIKPYSLLGKHIDLEFCQNEAAKECGVPLDSIEDIYPTTAMQEALMAVSAHRIGAYHRQIIFEIPKSVDLHRFKAAWEAVVKTQVILRTRIVVLRKTGAVQVVLKPSDDLFWHTGTLLQQYLEDDLNHSMTYGADLSRYGIVQDQYFVWSGHHSVYDGWSISKMLDLVRQHYESGSVQSTTPYNSFVKFLQDNISSDSVEFWRSQFPDIIESYPRLPAAGYVPVSCQSKSTDLTLQKKVHENITTATVVKAAWALVTAQHTGTDNSKTCFGLTLSGRDVALPGIDNMMGPSIVTIPFRTDIDYGQTTGEYLQDVQNHMAQIGLHQHIGLQKIRQLSGEARAATNIQNLLFIQIANDSEESPLQSIGVTEIPGREEDFQDIALIVECAIKSKSITIRIQYDKLVVPDGEAECLLHQFAHTIRQLVEADVTLLELNMMSDYDLLQLSTWSTPKPHTLESTIHELFEKQVLARPNAIATSGFDVEYTYAKLNEVAENLASHLTKFGVRPEKESKVVLCFNKSTWAIVSMLAILKSGGACVSVSPTHPVKRLIEISDDLDAQIVMCDAESATKFEGHVPHIMIVNSALVDQIGSQQKQPNRSRPLVRPDNVAVVVYTSGSTGKPKGAVLEHRSLCSSLVTMTKHCGMDENSRTLQFCAYTFDVHMLEIFGTLINGGCVCIVSETERLDIGALQNVIVDRRVNWLSLTPTVARLLSPEKVVPPVKTLYLIGEPLAQQDYQQWADHVNLLNAYGPAEASVAACISRTGVKADADPRNIGHPLNCNLWITEATTPDRLVPIGCIGELLIEGTIVGRGYINRPEITAKAFITDPVWSRKQDFTRRFYRTGDLAKFNCDGSVTFIGRNDTQVKIRGQRVELGEIEKTIQENLEGCSVAVELIKPANESLTPILTAFTSFEKVEAQNRPENTQIPAEASFDILDGSLVENLTSKLRNTLPDYMIPAYFILLPKLPLSANGKLDRTELRRLGTTLKTEELTAEKNTLLDIQPPTTDLEIALSRLWSEVLRISTDVIGTRTNFLHLGGDSIGAMKLVAAARQEGIHLTIGKIFERPVLQDMATSVLPLSDAMKESSTIPFSTINASNIETFLKEVVEPQLYEAHEGIEDVITITDFQAQCVSYAINHSRWRLLHFLSTFKMDISIQQLVSACQQLVKRHDALRTVFVSHAKRYLQVVLRQLEIQIEVHNTSEDPREFAKGIAVDDLRGNFELGSPWSKFWIISGSNKDICLLTRLSHAIYDGTSYPILFRDLQNILQGKQMAQPTSFQSYLNFIATAPTSEGWRYWKETLSGCKITQLPRHERASQVTEGGEAILHHEKLISIPPCPKNFTLSSLLSAIYALVISDITHKEDIVFGQVMSGRNVPLLGADQIMGACINSVPLRVQLSDSKQNLTSLLRRVQDQKVASTRYETYQFSAITREVLSDNKSDNSQNIPWLIYHQNMSKAVATKLETEEYMPEVGATVDDEVSCITEIKDNQLSILFIGQQRRRHFISIVMDKMLEYLSAVKVNGDEIYLDK